MRKALEDSPDRVQEAVADFRALSEARYEFAKEAYDAQDDKTRDAIDIIHKTLQEHANSYVHLRLPGGATHQVKVEAEYIGYNLLFLAVEAAKNLAFFDIRLANFKFPEMQCSNCGSPIKGKK